MFAIRRFLPRMVFGLLLLLPVSIANAEDEKKDAGPWYDVAVMPRENNWLPWVVATAFIAFSVGVAMKNPHRSYLD